MKRNRLPDLPIFLAFFLSGASGLMYQTVWVRMLTRYLGSTTAATSTVLAVFMGGLALGAYFGGKIADRLKQPLWGYVILELGIALSGVLVSLVLMSVLGDVYVNLYRMFGNQPGAILATRIVFCMACLLLPTIGMGATLPLLMACLSRTHYFQTGLAKLYAINTFGAVTGVVLTGFVLLGWLGERATLYTAAALNLAAAFLAYLLISSARSVRPAIQATTATNTSLTPSAYSAPVRYWARVVIAISGFTALAYEILWTRLLMLPLETSVYAFSAMLGFFLIGIALGSELASRLNVSTARPVALYALFEIAIGLLTAFGLWIFLSFGTLSQGFTRSIPQNIGAAFLIVFPVALVFGWQFPVAVRCCLSPSGQPGQETGWAYAANTVGAILGSLIAGFILIPLLGTAHSFAALALLNIGAGVIGLWLCPPAERGKTTALAGALMIVVFVGLTVLTGDPYQKVIQQKVVRKLGPDAKIYDFHEDVSGTTVPAGSPTQTLRRELFINGVSMTELCTETKLMAHLPLLLAKEPQHVLVVCFGMGTTVRSATKFPTIRTLDISAIDLIPKVFDAFPYFHPDAAQIAALPNVHFYADDGRNFLLVQPKQYDVITIDPAPPVYSAGTVNLYTREFLTLCKAHLTPGGVICLWVPPTQKTEALMIMKTFVQVFPGASLWGALEYQGFYLIGGHRSFEQTEADLSTLARQLSAIDDLHEWGPTYGDEAKLRTLYLLSPTEFETLVRDVPVITDDHPYTEFPLWRQAVLREPNFTAEAIRSSIQQ